MKKNKSIEFKIHGIDWDLILVDGNEIEALGETNYLAYEIKIVNYLKESQFKTVLRHELTHAFRWTYGNVSEMELLNIPSAEVEEMIANTVDVFGEDIVNLTNELMSVIKKQSK